MACKDCERRRAQMKEWLKQKAEQAAKWARVRNAKQAANAQPRQAKGSEARTEAGRSASDASAEHGQQGVATAAPIDTGPGRVSVPRVRKARDGQGSAR